MTTERHEDAKAQAPRRHVVVLNQFAVPPDLPGGARHARLFGRLQGWSTTIVAASHSHSTQRRVRTEDSRFRLVWVPPHHRRPVVRVAGWFIYSAQAFAVTVTRPKIDLVYGSSPHLLAPLAGLLAARLRRVPFVFEVRDLWPESIVAAGMLREGSTVHRVLARLERLLVRSADTVVAVTPGWEDHFAELGLPTDRLTIIPNGADPAEFVVSEARDALRAEHGIAGFTAVFAGSHGPKDGIHLILEAARELPDVHFILIGDGPVKASSTEYARRHGLRNVEFRDPVPKTHLARLHAACDVGIHAVSPLSVFDHGMSPNKLFDYMAAGLPIVSNAQDGLRAVITDGECGRVGNTGALAEGLRAVRDASPAQRAEWGTRGRQILEERYSRSVAAAQLEAALDAAVSTHRARRRRRGGRLWA